MLIASFIYTIDWEIFVVKFFVDTLQAKNIPIYGSKMLILFCLIFIVTVQPRQ